MSKTYASTPLPEANKSQSSKWQSHGVNQWHFKSPSINIELGLYGSNWIFHCKELAMVCVIIGCKDELTEQDAKDLAIQRVKNRLARMMNSLNETTKAE